VTALRLRNNFLNFILFLSQYIRLRDSLLLVLSQRFINGTCLTNADTLHVLMMVLERVSPRKIDKRHRVLYPYLKKAFNLSAGDN
jgi:hypothetical protein